MLAAEVFCSAIICAIGFRIARPKAILRMRLQKSRCKTTALNISNYLAPSC